MTCARVFSTGLSDIWQAALRLGAYTVPPSDAVSGSGAQAEALALSEGADADANASAEDADADWGSVLLILGHVLMLYGWRCRSASNIKSCLQPISIKQTKSQIMSELLRISIMRRLPSALSSPRIVLSDLRAVMIYPRNN